MRVVYLNPVGEVGGGERSLLVTMAAVGRAWPGVERVLIAGTDGLLLARAREMGIAVHLVPLSTAVQGLGDSGLRGQGRAATVAALGRRLPAAGLGAWNAVRRLRDLLRRLRPDLVHSNGIKTHVLSTLAAPRGVPVLWHVRDYLGERPVIRWLLRAVPRPALAVANSRSVADDARRVLRGVPVEAVLNAIDTDRFTPGPGDGPALDRLAGLPPTSPGVVRVGLVATYARWKGQDVYLRAAAEVGPAARFYVVGSPIYRTAGSQFTESELRELAARHGVADRVGFVPYQEDTAAVYRALDVVVHASTRPEPFGLTIAESMSCGRPTVVAAAGGAAELFTDGADAIGHAPGDAAGLAKAVARLVADADLRARIGVAARQTAVERFGLKRYEREIDAVYRRLVRVL